MYFRGRLFLMRAAMSDGEPQKHHATSDGFLSSDEGGKSRPATGNPPRPKRMQWSSGSRPIGAPDRIAVSASAIHRFAYDEGPQR